MAPTLTQIANDSRWLCHGFDPVALALHFRYADATQIENAAFLDAASLGSAGQAAFPLDQVAETIAAVAAPAPAPQGFLIHTAFCCSTLLAKCIEIPLRVSVLRELPVFSGLARARLALLEGGHAQAWPSLLRTVGLLTARPLWLAGFSFNKPSNTFLPVVGDCLVELPAARAILIYGDLPGFLISCVKKLQAGQAPWHAMYAGLDPTGDYARTQRIELTSASPLRLACLIWHFQMEALGRLPAAAAARIRCVDVARFLKSPVGIVEATLAFLTHGAIRECDPALVASALGRDSKRPGRQYDAQRRQAEAAAARDHFDPAIEQALRWSEHAFGAWQAKIPDHIRPLDPDDDARVS